MTHPEHDLDEIGTAYRMRPLAFQTVAACAITLAGDTCGHQRRDALLRHRVRTA